MTPRDRDDAREEREREVEEERQYLRQYRGADALPGPGDIIVHHTAKVVREWVRSVLVPPAIKRMYDIGMGVQTFSTPTAVGSVIEIEAPPAVQQKALASLIAIGVPGQLGLVDNDGQQLPGVFALGPLDLDAARQDVHGDRYVSPEAHARARAALLSGDVLPTAGHNGNGNGNGSHSHEPLRPMSERIAAGEFEVVEVEEGVGMPETATHDDEAPPPIEDDVQAQAETPEREALRRHRERMQQQKTRPSIIPGLRDTPPKPEEP